jgi:hypothetical protein
MQLPYVSSPDLALSAAQVATAAVLTILVWYRPLQSALGSVLLVLGIWLAARAPAEVRWLISSGLPHPQSFERLDWVLGLSSLTFVLAALLQRRRSVQVAAVLAAWLVHEVGQYVVASDGERAVLQVVLGAFVYSLARPPAAPAGVPSNGRFFFAELGIFVLGVLAASFVAVYVLDRFIASGDEWGYQYQADLFSHGKLYGSVPECPSVHETYWVYYWQGRAFCQYTPSWPLVLAPFQRLGIWWLGSPVVFAAGLVGVSRLARRAAAERPGLGSTAETRAAGVVAPLVLCASGAMLLNAGSAFSHAFVCALFAWSAEALFKITSPGLTRREEWGWGLAFGSLVALLLGARPGDGAALIPGMAIYGIYALARGTVGRRTVAAGCLGFGFFAVVILVILRVQLGQWFQTGYSLTETFRPWGTIHFSWPKPDEWKYGIPLATSAYCFWPCSLAVSVIGGVMAYRRRSAVPLVLCTGVVLQYAFYSAVTGGRHFDWGYGPRYVLPTIVPIAVFSGVALAPLFVPLGRSSASSLFRAAAVVGAIVYGTWTIGGLLYPVAMHEIHRNGAPYRAISQARLKNAVVVFPANQVAQDPGDLTQNLPTNRNPDVVYLIEGPPPEMQCARRLYADRKWYRATGIEEVQLQPLD